jgi:invasion protein IalB
MGTKSDTNSNISMKLLGIVAAAALVAIAGTAAAQTPTRPAMPRSTTPAASTQHPAPVQVQAAAPTDTPQRTTATYADWVVQCEARPGPPPEKVCDMSQTTQLQGRNVPFSRVAVAHPVKGQPVKLVVQVPVNVALATNVRLQTGDADPGLAAPFARCVPGGCFADFDLKDETLKKLRVAAAGGKLSFADAGGHDIAVPLSFNGFAQAFDALAKE